MAKFIEPMECLPVSRLPEGPQGIWEIKLDGYRAVVVKSNGNVTVFSRRGKSFNTKFPLICEALFDLPDDTVIDGEIVALDESGRPAFNLLQNFRKSAKQIYFFVFDLLVLEGHDITKLPLVERRKTVISAKYSKAWM